MSLSAAEELIGIGKFISAEEIIMESQYNYFTEAIENLIDDAFVPLPSEWAEEFRYLPSTVSENYGYWDATKAKHIADILDLVHPDDPATHISVIKSVQSGLTVSLGENAMGFFTKYRLGSVAFFTSTKEVGKTRSNSALDVMIDNSGLSDLIEPMSNRTGRRSADTTFSKEFAGGIRWQISSYGSIADQKSNTFNLIILDEWDEAPPESKNQGDTAGVIEGRTMAVRMFKVLAISTSSAMETSRIHKNFIEGDQCRYFIPCPHCGHKQHLKMKFSNDEYGLTFSMKKDPITGARVLDENSIRYICANPDCRKSFRELHKNEAIEQGEWRPTWMDTPYVPKSPKHRSFHIPGLLSPFLQWKRICQQFINTDFGKNLLLFKDFTINYLGEPWARVVTKAEWEDLKERADEYIMGEPPKGSCLIYGGCDVQMDRLELNLLTVGADMEKWILDYQVFYGNPADEHDKCWNNLHDFVYSQQYNIEGVRIGITLVAIDTGYDPKESREKDWDSKAHTVYNFVASRTDKFIAVRGTANNKTSDLVRERSVKHTYLKKRFDIATPIIKEMLMMIIEETDGPNSIHFPKWRMYEGVKVPVSDEFFQQFLSERFQEVEPGKMGWKKIRARNEVWDTTIYAIAAMYYDGLQLWKQETWESYLANLRNIANSK